MGEGCGQTTEIQRWLDLMRAGDAAARDQIINHACERLRRLTRKMLGGFARLRRWEQTDDVLQNALIKLHRSLADVQPESTRMFFALATKQIRRSLIDLARHHFGPLGSGRHHQTAGHGAAADDTGGPIQHEVGETCEPEDAEAWTRFHEAAGNLPASEQEVFDLLWYQGMTQVETASVLGVDERTVRRRWDSARCLLYDALKGNPPE